MQLPAPRGPLSTEVLGGLACDGPDGNFDASHVLSLLAELPSGVDLVTDDDFHLALWVMYELAYRGFEEVDPEWEWDAELLRVRRAFEARFEAELRMRTAGYVKRARRDTGDVPDQLFALTESMNGPSIARHIQRHATREQFVEFMKQRSIYHLKESDPHSFVLPRLAGRAKVALAELQYDEYGGGRPARLHAAMFGDSLEAAGLDRQYGAYIDHVPGYTLAVNNAMSLLCLHRRLRAAAAGHLGAFEATSSLPCRRVAGGIRRLGLSETVAAYFDEHVEADAVHEQLAFRDICGTIATEEPDRIEDLFFGAAVCLYLDAVAGQEMLDAWEHGGSSLFGTARETVA